MGHYFKPLQVFFHVTGPFSLTPVQPILNNASYGLLDE